MIAAERRLRERQQRIHEIIEAAKHIFKTKGFASATMLDIAEHSELSRRTLYLYFNNKDEVSLALASDTLARLGNEIEDVVGRPGLALERLRALLDVYLALHHQDPSSFQVILNFDMSVRAVGERHELARKCYSEVSRIRRLVAGLLQEGAADGSVRVFPDPEIAAATLVTMVHSTLQCAVSSANILLGPLSLAPPVFIDKAFEIIMSYLPVT
jgi:AcrR family transcriptional regulator